MNDSNVIMVVIDPTVHEQRSLKQAAILAEKMQKELRLLICTHDESLQHYQGILDQDKVKSSVSGMLDQLLARLEKMAKPYRKQGLSVSCDVVWDRPVDEGIIRKALQVKPFLIVKETHYHPKLTRSIIRNTDWSLIRTCPYPLLLVKNHLPWQSPVIFSAVNPVNNKDSQLDADIVRFGEFMESSMGATHRLVHVCEPLTVSYVGVSTMGYAVTLNEQYDEILSMHQKCIDKLAEDENISPDKISFNEGSVVQLLPKLVDEKNVDLVIMGSTSKSRIAQVFIGGTTESVLDDIDCDVLILKPQTFVSPVSDEVTPEYPQVVWPTPFL